MGWNGDGTFSREHNWQNDADNDIDIVPDRHDAEDDNFATGIQAALAKNGENTPTANLPMGNNKHTGVGDASARTDYAKTSQVQDGAYSYSADTGSADTYVMTLSPAITAYATGAEYRFKAANTNTGASTLNINGVGATSIKKAGSSDVEAGDIPSGSVITVVYDGTNFQITGINGVTASTSEINQLDGITSGVLENNDLAANGGNVVTDDRGNTFTADQNVTGVDNSNKGVHVTGDGFVGISITAAGTAGDTALYNTYSSRGTVGSPLSLSSGDRIMTLAPRPYDGASYLFSNNYNLAAVYDGSGVGWVAGNATGGPQGDGTINAKDVLVNGTSVANPASSSGPSLGLDTWRTPNSARATLVTVTLLVKTDGTTNGRILTRVDESGGTGADYGFQSYALANAVSSNTTFYETFSFIVPAGGSYEFNNASDPVGTNSIYALREFTL